MRKLLHEMVKNQTVMDERAKILNEMMDAQEIIDNNPQIFHEFKVRTGDTEYEVSTFWIVFWTLMFGPIATIIYFMYAYANNRIEKGEDKKKVKKDIIEKLNKKLTQIDGKKWTPERKRKAKTTIKKLISKIKSKNL